MQGDWEHSHRLMRLDAVLLLCFQVSMGDSEDLGSSDVSQQVVTLCSAVEKMAKACRRLFVRSVNGGFDDAGRHMARYGRDNILLWQANLLERTHICHDARRARAFSSIRLHRLRCLLRLPGPSHVRTVGVTLACTE